jgi:hypothetical protein
VWYGFVASVTVLVCDLCYKQLLGLVLMSGGSLDEVAGFELQMQFC